ncbi:MAG: GntR family transcriptional regulator [Acidobacteria bacterium]|nr:GntR family transcriptional regulator [Acidobacteriota bacterium]
MRDPAENQSLAGEAYSIVRQRILRGELAMGQVISRRKLAAELGMSFLPVSEALLRLEIEGLLESRPRAGTRVRIPTRQDVRGHYVVREALEVQAAKLFAEVATSEERSELVKLAARVDALSVQTDRFLYLTLHEKLHRRVAECARCPALSGAIEKTHALASTWFCVTRQPVADKPPRRHQELVEILVKGDPEAAADAMSKHVVRSMESTMQRLEPYFKLRKTHGRTYVRTEKNQIRPN